MQQESQIEALKKELRASENAYRHACGDIIEIEFGKLSESQQDAVRKEFQLSLDSSVYVNSFKSSGWRDRLNSPDIFKFWDLKGISLPSPSDWADQSGMKAPETIRENIDTLQAKFN